MQGRLPGHDALVLALRRRELDCLQAQDAQPHPPPQASAQAASGAGAAGPAHRPPRRLPPLSPRGASHPALPPQLGCADPTSDASPACASGAAAGFGGLPPRPRAAAAWGFGALRPRRAASDGAEAATRSAPGGLAAGAVAAPLLAGGRGLRRVASEDFSFCVPGPDRLGAAGALLDARARRAPTRPGSGPAGDPGLPAARRPSQRPAPYAAAGEHAGPPWLAAGLGAGADAAARLTALLASGEGAAGSCAGSGVGCSQRGGEATEAAAAGAAPGHITARESLARFSEIIARSAGGAAGADAAPSPDCAPGRDSAGAPGGSAARGDEPAVLAVLPAAPGAAAPGGAVARQALPSLGAPPCGVMGSGAAQQGDASEEAAGEGAPEGADAGGHGRAAPVASLTCLFEMEPGGGIAGQAKPARAGAPSGQAPSAAGSSPQSSADSCTAVAATLADTAATAGPYPSPAPGPAPGARARASAALASARPAPGPLPPGLHVQLSASAQARARWLARVSPGAPFGSSISLGSALGSPAGSTAGSKHSGSPASEQSTATQSTRARHSSEGGDSDPGDVWSTALSGAGSAGPPAQAHIDESCLGAHISLAASDAGSSKEPNAGGGGAAEQSGGDAAAAPAPAGRARSGGGGGGGADGDGSDCDSVALGWEAESACSRISGDGWGPGASPASLARVSALPRWRADAVEAAVDRLVTGPARRALLRRAHSLGDEAPLRGSGAMQPRPTVAAGAGRFGPGRHTGWCGGRWRCKPMLPAA